MLQSESSVKYTHFVLDLNFTMYRGIISPDLIDEIEILHINRRQNNKSHADCAVCYNYWSSVKGYCMYVPNACCDPVNIRQHLLYCTNGHRFM